MQTLTHAEILALLIVGFLLIAAGSLLAQSVTGAFVCTVTGPSGAAIVGAKVLVANQATNISTTLMADSHGFYSVEALTVGKFPVGISKASDWMAGLEVDKLNGYLIAGTKEGEVDSFETQFS